MDSIRRERFYTMEKVCELCCLSERTIRRLISADRFPTLIKVGSRRLFVASEIHDWIDEQIEATRASS